MPRTSCCLKTDVLKGHVWHPRNSSKYNSTTVKHECRMKISGPAASAPTICSKVLPPTYVLKTLMPALPLLLLRKIIQSIADSAEAYFIFQAVITCRVPFRNHSAVSAVTLPPANPKARLMTAVAIKPRPSILVAENLAPSTPPASLQFLESPAFRV